MNIAVIRPNRAIKIGLTKRSTSGGAEELTGVIRGLAERGHRVTIYSKVSPFRDEEIWKELQALGVRYEPDGDLSPDENALFIDNAPWINLMGEENVLCSARGFDVLAQWEGEYLYHQSDVHPAMNLPNNFLRYSGPESRKRVFPFIRVGPEELHRHLMENTHPVVLLKTQHSEALGRHMQQTYDFYGDSKYTSFKQWNCSVYLLPFLEDRLLYGRPQVCSEDEVEYLIAYLGHPRNRDLWFLDRGAEPTTDRSRRGLGVHIWGSFNEKLKAEWHEGGRPWPVFHDKVNPTEIPAIYQRSGVHPSTVDRKILGFSWFPARYYEAVWSGCPLLIEDRVFKDPSDSYIGQEFLFNRSNWYDRVADIVHHRKEAVQAQFERLMTQPTGVEVTTQLEELLAQHQGSVRRLASV